ncbi:hypothetical protein HFO88_27530 [Rhizobium leguminosarum]|uniref:DNA ligase (ATP) n=1 Tax=Rhizobium leguminosarum bv. viciae TaxID=387 RepID=A0A7G6RLW3_RHILV|nr:hypothetical protein [Rhizobium leguminosarum]MBY5911164.1 hypothetical protein [Rhizobium leguminosarum]NKK93559.1 hypothetical protein [Rhizobium leguminosarum bv. viciae]QND43245.1 hypothetical protein HB770_10360 [Rhizobium leguminosarum bv. viciae]
MYPKCLSRHQTCWSPPVDRKGAIFVKPKLIAEIGYRGWTDDGKLRHASYKGLRDRQDNAAVYELSF